ncbi:DUF4240 domain-containing protein [Streptomyces sp. NPDC001530]|uniref:DUF4240 domain-containing protein n=1 Tax=Streptomyces sp. NPDC001530 TaxID=3364582 RepID=UPI0036A9D323
MDEGAFWQLIEECRPAAPDPDGVGLAAGLIGVLVAGPLYAVIGFAEQLSWALYRLDRWQFGLQPKGRELSGDQFLYTRAAVVAAGRAEYERVLTDSSRFAPYAAAPVSAESLLYVPDESYERITGEEWDRRTRYDYESYSNAKGWVGAPT